MPDGQLRWTTTQPTDQDLNMEFCTWIFQFGSDLFKKIGPMTNWTENYQAFQKAWFKSKRRLDNLPAWKENKNLLIFNSSLNFKFNNES